MAFRTVTRITRAKQEEIYQRYSQGDTLTNLARCFGVSSSRIKQIIVDVSRAKSRPSLSDKLKEAYPDVYPGTVVGAVNCMMRSGYYKGTAISYMPYKDFFAVLSTIKDDDLLWIRNMGTAKMAFLKRAMSDYQHGVLREQ